MESTLSTTKQAKVSDVQVKSASPEYIEMLAMVTLENPSGKFLTFPKIYEIAPRR